MNQRGKLKTNRFSYRVRKENRVSIIFENKEIMVVKDIEAQELVRNLEDASEYEIQYYLAILTGHFKHGNERVSKNKEKMKRGKI